MKNLFKLIQAEQIWKNEIFFLLIVEKNCKASEQFALIWKVWIKRYEEQKRTSVRWAIRERKQIPHWVEFLQVPKENVPLLVSFPDRPSFWGQMQLWKYLNFCSPLVELSTWKIFATYISEIQKKGILNKGLQQKQQDQKQTIEILKPKWTFYNELC